jgi:hypothetical protein
VPDDLAGFCIAGLSVLVRAVPLIYWRLGNVADQWSSGAAMPATITRETR